MANSKTPWRRLAVIGVMVGIVTPWVFYLQVNVSVNRTGHAPVASTLLVELPKTPCVNRTEEKNVEKIVYVNNTVEVPKITYVNRTEEKIVYVEVQGPERIVSRDKIVEKIVQVNHTVEKIVEVLKIIFVEKNLTEGTVWTCKAGYYYSTAGARFEN
jgi:hypothetical protein